MGEERTHPKLMKKGWRPAAMGPLCRAVTDKKKKKKRSPCLQRRLGIRAEPLGGLGSLSRSWELKMAPWELTGKVRREERDHGVRKLPVPGAGRALQTPRGYGGCGGSRDRRRKREMYMGRKYTEPETPD